MLRQDTKITMIEETYSRTDSGRYWKNKPDETETRIIDRTQYENITDDKTCQWFRRLGGSETKQYTYTKYGYLCYCLSSCSPDREIKRVRRFSFE